MSRKQASTTTTPRAARLQGRNAKAQPATSNNGMMVDPPEQAEQVWPSSPHTVSPGAEGFYQDGTPIITMDGVQEQDHPHDLAHANLENPEAARLFDSIHQNYQHSISITAAGHENNAAQANIDYCVAALADLLEHSPQLMAPMHLQQVDDAEAMLDIATAWSQILKVGGVNALLFGQPQPSETNKDQTLTRSYVLVLRSPSVTGYRLGEVAVRAEDTEFQVDPNVVPLLPGFPAAHLVEETDSWLWPVSTLPPGATFYRVDGIALAHTTKKGAISLHLSVPIEYEEVQRNGKLEVEKEVFHLNMSPLIVICNPSQWSSGEGCLLVFKIFGKHAMSMEVPYMLFANMFLWSNQTSTRQCASKHYLRLLLSHQHLNIPAITRHKKRQAFQLFAAYMNGSQILRVYSLDEIMCLFPPVVKPDGSLVMTLAAFQRCWTSYSFLAYALYTDTKDSRKFFLWNITHVAPFNNGQQDIGLQSRVTPGLNLHPPGTGLLRNCRTMTKDGIYTVSVVVAPGSIANEKLPSTSTSLYAELKLRRVIQSFLTTKGEIVSKLDILRRIKEDDPAEPVAPPPPAPVIDTVSYAQRLQTIPVVAPIVQAQPPPVVMQQQFPDPTTLAVPRPAPMVHIQPLGLQQTYNAMPIPNHNDGPIPSLENSAGLLWYSNPADFDPNDQFQS